jgi:hypothetical protein
MKQQHYMLPEHQRLTGAKQRARQHASHEMA